MLAVFEKIRNMGESEAYKKFGFLQLRDTFSPLTQQSRRTVGQVLASWQLCSEDHSISLQQGLQRVKAKTINKFGVPLLTYKIDLNVLQNERYEWRSPSIKCASQSRPSRVARGKCVINIR